MPAQAKPVSPKRASAEADAQELARDSDYFPERGACGGRNLVSSRQGRRLHAARRRTHMASFSVVSNISASNAQANLQGTNLGLQKALTRLSSGFRINSAGDDAAGLAVANSYRGTQAVLNQGIRNANDGLSTLQIKDGALNNIGTLLDRLSTLATQSASAASTVDRTALNAEYADVLTEITREGAVAGLDTAQGFSVFISAESTAS